MLRKLPRLPLPVLEALMVVTWSSGFVGMRFSAGQAPIFLVMLWRLIAVSVCLLPFVAREIGRAPAAVLLRQAGIGVLAMAGYLIGVSKGIALGVPAGLAALIADLLPLGTVLVSTFALRERHPRRVWAGLALGLAGTLVVCRDAVALGAAPVWAYALPVAGMASLAVATVWQQRASGRHAGLSPLGTLWLQCAASCPVFVGLQATQGRLLPIASAGFAASVAWTVILATLGGCGLYWACLRRSSPSRVTSVLFLSPPVTFIWAWAMFGEPLSWLMLVGTAISGLGVLLMAGRSAGGSAH
ncbi:DMT family transporter [Burkholderia perseverans]|uniref:DMT family transporter n=1 Tax=Burkholderia perseverans TaxID=2615214 RepID=UPI003140B7D5